MKRLRFAALAFFFGGTALTAFLIFHSEKNKTENIISLKENNRGFSEGDEHNSDALEALQFISRSRAYPNADIPNDAYARAWQTQNTRFASSTSQSVGSWTNLGPNNCGGRTLCVAIDPTDTNTVWLGSASGGLWRSTVGGIGVNAWTYINTGFPVLGVATIAINPNNHLEMYIGTGETYNYGNPVNGLTDRTTRGTVGMGILKSVDGGVTWSYSLNWTYQQMRTVWDIQINPLRPASVLAATSEGIYKSTDAGANWTQVLNEKMAMDIKWNAGDTTVALCGVGDLNSTNKGLYRSVDGGLNWALAGGGFPNATAHAGRIQLTQDMFNNDIVLAQMSDIYNTIGFYLSTNKGATWTTVGTQDITGYQGWYCEGMALEPGNQNNILAGGVNMYLSTNGGTFFNQVSDMNSTPDVYMHSDVHDIVVNPQNPNSIFIATDGGLFRSYDFGTTYFDCNDGYVTSQHYIGSCSTTDPNYMLSGLQDNFTFMYTGSPYWSAIIGGDGCYNIIDPTDDNINYAAYQFLNVFQTFDKWQVTFNQICSSPASATGGNSQAFLAPYCLAPSNNLRIYAGEQWLDRSDDQGTSFSQVGPALIDNGNCILSIGVSSTQEDCVYVATAPDVGPTHLLLSTNGGTTFVDRSTGLPDRFPRRITVDPRNSRIVYVVFSGFGTGHIFKTVDAGVTWTDISTSLPDAPFHCLMCDPQFPDIIYAGGDIGVYVSTDGGATWNTHNTGMQDWTMVFDLVPSLSDRGIIAFTHGHGVYKRSMNDISGIHDPATQTISLNVFPNPVQDIANISLGELYADATVTIVDLNGKVLHEEKVTKQTSLLRVDVSEWAEGVYLVNVISGKSSATTKMLVD